jgi:hypothetical protein
VIDHRLYNKSIINDKKNIALKMMTREGMPDDLQVD